jgi:ribosomal protein L37E
MATCRRCGKEFQATTETTAVAEVPASWRVERIVRFAVFPIRRAIVFSELIATYAWLLLAFLAVAILAVGAGIVWLVLYANWSYLAGQNMALPIMAVIIFVIAILTILVKKTVDVTRATHYCSSCHGILTAQKLRRPEESGPHKIKTRRE